MTDNVIGPDENWQENRREDGTYWHPVFFSEENAYDESKWDALIEKYNLETHYLRLGDGYPRAIETRLRALYDNAAVNPRWEDAMREWVPHKANLPGDMHAWFLLTIYDTEDGPFACFVRKKD